MSGLEFLRINKEAILKAEITSMLALWEKILPSTGINKTNKNIKNVDWKNQLNNKEIIFRDLNGVELKRFKLWENFIDNWRNWRSKNNTDFILQILYGIAESLNSGIDKGSPKGNIKVQPEEKRWLANAFGSFKQKIIYLLEDENEINNTIDEIKNSVLNVLNKRDISLNELEEIRNILKNFLSGLLSDDRFPINDISLWEQTFMPTSMFKALLSDYILKHPNFDKTPDRNSITWCILGIQYNKRGLSEKSLKLPSIRWYRDTIQEIDRKIKELLEVKYPIGNEIYRDETGIYFVVGENIKDFKGFIEERLDWLFEDHLQGEIYPYVTFSKPSRGLMNLSTLIEQAKENFLKYSKKSIWLWKLNECKLQKSLCNAVGICPICQVRFITEKDREKRNKPPICEVCDDRIHHKSVEKWLKHLQEETIWMDEIKDKNNKVAYVTLKFELLEWLNGNLLNNILINTLKFEDYLQKSIKFLIFLAKYKKILHIINEEIDKKIESNKKKYGYLNQLKNRLNRKINVENLINDFLEKTIDNLIKVDKFNEVKVSTKFNDLKRLKNDLTNFQTSKLIKDTSLNLLNSHLNIFIDYLNGFTSFIEDFLLIYSADSIKGHAKAKSSFENYIKQIFFENLTGTTFWEIFIYKQLKDWDFTQNKPLKQKIDFEKRKIYWDKLIDEDIEFLATLILQFLLRKNPSPARLRRIWESTKEFFEKIHQDLGKSLEIPEWRRKRIIWTLNKEKFKNVKSTGEELEDERGLLYWASPKEKEIYLISNIKDFLLQYGDKDIEKLLMDLDNATTSKEVSEINEKLNQLLENIKDHLEVEEISLHKIGEKQNNLEISIKIKGNIELQKYSPYSLITDTTPTNYQVIIPAEYLPNFIDKVIEKYDEHFKYVYGKLPIHIGIVVSRYDRPVYVNLQALRRIRRDVQDIDKLWIEKPVGEFCILQRKKLGKARHEEIINETEKYYSLYFHNTDEKDYYFYIKPDKNWKHWISTIDKFPQHGKVKIIPNTFDFEYLDHNIRRTEIFYTDDGKRIPYLRSNRPYELETHWWKFKKFRELIKDTNLPSNRLHKLVEVLYSHLLDIQGLEDPNWERRSYTLLAEFANWLELQKEEKRRELIKEIFDLNTAEWEAFKEQLREALTKEENIKLFVDMFDFWHNLMEEV